MIILLRSGFSAEDPHVGIGAFINFNLQDVLRNILTIQSNSVVRQITLFDVHIDSIEHHAAWCMQKETETLQVTTKCHRAIVLGEMSEFVPLDSA